MKKIYLVTPLRDEMQNIDQLITSISNNSYPIAAWVVVENNSTDGSKDKLDKIKSVRNVEKFIVINRDDFSKSYQLGGKYSAIVNEGFKYVEENFKLDEEDFIGILDADSFPNPNYYKELVHAFDQDSCLGITSGRAKALDTDRESIHSKSWVMGSCRLWRYKCFRDSGYEVGPSADTISVALAEIMNWKVYPIQNVFFYAREVGQRVDFSYYGKSAYFRGNTLIYAFFRSLKYFLKMEFKNSYMFLMGYLKDFLKNEPKISNLQVRAYFSSYLLHSIRKKFNR
ncbi:glycosyltransferase family 2 protein [Rheinheimera gaetbuli]